jgi:hypothetical protein
MRNSDIAELLARSAETAKQPFQRAMRRAARRAFLWPQEAEEMHRHKQGLTELSGIGPYLEKLIVGWLNDNPEPEGKIPDIRRGFLTIAEAGTLRSKEPARFGEIDGNLQMHTLWRTIDTNEVNGFNVFRSFRVLDHEGCFGSQHRSDDCTRVAAL